MAQRRIGRLTAGVIGLLLALPLAALAEGSPQRVAVLELSDDGAQLPGPALRILADAGRKAALSLDGRRYQVLTREAMVALIPAGPELAALCADGACEVTLGRRLGVDYVLSGAVTRLEGQLRADLKLHETAQGRLLAVETGRGDSVGALEAAILSQARGMFLKLPGVSAHERLDAKLSQLPAAKGAAVDEGFATKLADLAAARAAREQAEASEAAARAAALAEHTAEVDARFGQLRAEAEASPAQGLAALAVFLEHYAAHPLGNPRQQAAEALRGQLAAEMHAAEVAQAWQLAAEVAAGGGPEGVAAVEAFLGRYAGHPLGNPKAAEAEARLRALGGARAQPEITWITLPAGEFQMGDPEGDEDERPVRAVRLGAFELSKTEVTVAQYAACVDAGACSPARAKTRCNWGKPDRDRHPINCVDWRQAQAFARWARARLPTEAEWEYAARSAGERVPWPWGAAPPDCSRARFGLVCEQRSGVRRLPRRVPTLGTAPVCHHPLGNTAQGLCDMAGNVGEWVEDGYGRYLEGAGDASAVQPGRRRVFRGGGWVNGSDRLRTAARASLAPAESNPSLGFRVARSVPSAEPGPAP